MGITTKIEYPDSTLNLQMGCDGCELWTKKVRTCYAGQMTDRYGGTNPGFPKAFDKPELFLHRLDAALKWPDLTGTDRPDKPWLNGMPRLIFLDDMGDTFTESLPLDWLAPLLARMAESPHQFLVLTKRGDRMRQFSERHPFPSNFWPGVSLTKQQSRRIANLMQVQGGGPKVLSVEPLLEPVHVLDAMVAAPCSSGGDDFSDWIQWVIVGCESDGRRAGRQPHGGEAAYWNAALAVRYQCGATGIKYIHKQGPINGRVSHDPAEWDEEIRVREMPAVAVAAA